MKKVFLTVLFLGIMVCVASAEIKVPEMKAGIGFSIKDSKVNHMETLELLKWKALSLEGGYMGDADATDHKAVLVLSYDLFDLKKYMDVPVLDLIVFRPGLYYGIGGINLHRILESEQDFGISATLISYKF